MSGPKNLGHIRSIPNRPMTPTKAAPKPTRRVIAVGHYYPEAREWVVRLTETVH